MNDQHAHRPVETDERFLGDWVAYGIRELEGYLRAHARFTDYCRTRDEGFRRLDAAVRALDGE